jgi:hypothetical protein
LSCSYFFLLLLFLLFPPLSHLVSPTLPSFPPLPPSISMSHPLPTIPSLVSRPQRWFSLPFPPLTLVHPGPCTRLSFKPSTPLSGSQSRSRPLIVPETRLPATRVPMPTPYLLSDSE